MPADDPPKPGLWAATKETVNEFLADDAMSQAAALAFYTGLAIAPLLTIAVWITRNVAGSGATERIQQGFAEVMGPRAAEPIGQLLDPAGEQAQQSMTAAGIVSLLILAFSASGVFAQLQTALNRMWDVQQKPSAGVAGYVRKRLLSFGMLVTLLFLLLVSGIVGAVVQGFVSAGGGGWWMQVVSVGASLAIFIPLFALLYKYIPDVRIAWSDVWVGATLTAALFVVGKFLLSLYLGRGSYESSYGAAVGAFVALLVWVYYSAIIVFVGAEATQVYARRRGHPVEPDEHAVRVVERREPAPA